MTPIILELPMLQAFHVSSEACESALVSLLCASSPNIFYARPWGQSQSP